MPLIALLAIAYLSLPGSSSLMRYLDAREPGEPLSFLLLANQETHCTVRSRSAFHWLSPSGGTCSRVAPISATAFQYAMSV